MLAICYSGTRDILQATRNICEKVKAGVLEPKDIDEAMFDKQLWTRGAPHPDLLIRTGGRLRVSDYLMWQLAQTELYFSQVSAPEFGEVEFLQALHSFQQRERTFGK
uniref:Alkyl transferase n=2 Tax=Chenopodium quinoa TaxID=63459 RepID=A0A803ML98_CHEQI